MGKEEAYHRKKKLSKNFCDRNVVLVNDITLNDNATDKFEIAHQKQTICK